jgi:hypothetical protein
MLCPFGNTGWRLTPTRVPESPAPTIRAESQPLRPLGPGPGHGRPQKGGTPFHVLLEPITGEGLLPFPASWLDEALTRRVSATGFNWPRDRVPAICGQTRPMTPGRPPAFAQAAGSAASAPLSGDVRNWLQLAARPSSSHLRTTRNGPQLLPGRQRPDRSGPGRAARRHRTSRSWKQPCDRPASRGPEPEMGTVPNPGSDGQHT